MKNITSVVKDCGKSERDAACLRKTWRQNYSCAVWISHKKPSAASKPAAGLVTDYELKYLAEVLNIPVRLLLEEEDSETTDPETVTAENFISAFQAGRFGESPTAHHPDKIIIDVTIRCLSDPPEKDK